MWLVFLELTLIGFAWLFNIDYSLGTNLLPKQWSTADGFNLGVMDLIWVSITVLLYFPHRWWARVKREQSSAWLSYL